MVTCVPGLVVVTEGCSTAVGGAVPGMVVRVADVTAVPRPVPEALASAASNGPTVMTVVAGTTRVIVLRDALVLVPVTPVTACAVVVPCVPDAGTVAGAPGAAP